MSNHWVCKICVAKNGLRGRDLKDWPLMGDEAAIARHLFRQHGVKVRNDGESEADCEARYRTSPP